MSLDTQTLAVVAAFVQLILSLLIAMTWGTRQTYPGFGRWTLGNLCLIFSLLFVGLRGIAPDWMTMVLGNSLGFVGGILFLEGIRKFRGLKPNVWAAYAGAALTTLVLAYFHWVVDDLASRAVAASLFPGFMLLACGVSLMKDIPSPCRFSRWFTGVMFGIELLDSPPIQGLQSGGQAGFVALGLVVWLALAIEILYLFCGQPKGRILSQNQKISSYRTRGNDREARQPSRVCVLFSSKPYDRSGFEESIGNWRLILNTSDYIYRQLPQLSNRGSYTFKGIANDPSIGSRASNKECLTKHGLLSRFPTQPLSLAQDAIRNGGCRITPHLHLESHRDGRRAASVLERYIKGQMCPIFVERKWAYGSHVERHPRAIRGFQSLLRRDCGAFGGISCVSVSTVHLGGIDGVDNKHSNAENLHPCLEIIESAFLYLATNILLGFGWWCGRNAKSNWDVGIALTLFCSGFIGAVWSGIILTNRLGI